MARRYFTLDVFTDTPLAGNPLAVVLDCDGLDGGAMQRIASEFNLSETVFVLPPEDKKHRARLRIFTPSVEYPFAGHPTVGAAVLLASLDHKGEPGSYLFGVEEAVGVISCAATIERDRAGRARFNLPRLPEDTEKRPAPDAVAQALGLAEADIGFENHHPTVYNAGVPFTLVPVRDLRAMGRIAVDQAIWREVIGDSDSGGAAYLYCRQTVGADVSFHARMFSPFGIGEDPATGSAVAALAGAIMRFDDLAAGEHLLRIEQGLEMGRPSLIELGLTIAGVSLTSVTIGGGAVLVGEGRLHV